MMENNVPVKNSKSGQDFNELGISLKNYSIKSASQHKLKRFNCKLKIYREFVLATLSTLTKERRQNLDKESSPSQFYALDAYSCTGAAAIQWKKHLQEDVHVTAADHDGVTVLTQNAEHNSLMCIPWQLDPSRVPGDPKIQQSRNEIFSCQAEAKSLMTMEAYNFIYLDPHKSNSTCLEPAFHSLASGGVLSFVVPDLSIFSRAPHVVQRSFSAQVIKTEYLKEMAARIVLAEAARSAAKYNKGISVLYVVSQDDFLLIAVRVARGQKAVDSSLNSVSHLLHCRFCEERVFLPNQLAPHDNPYSYLNCMCKSKNLGKTAVVLGPMWKGCIFNTNFLANVTEEGNRLKLSGKFFEMTSLVSAESRCSALPEKVASEPPHRQSKSAQRGTGNFCPDSERPQSTLSAVNNPSELSEQIKSPLETPASDHLKAKKISSQVEDKQDCDTLSGKRKLDLVDEDFLAKKQKKDFVEDTQQQGVPFYYKVSRSKKGVSHKLNKLVTLLQSGGHRASRTHFDPCAIRTSASVLQFVQTLD